jgi:hypothetical protein
VPPSLDDGLPRNRAARFILDAVYDLLCLNGLYASYKEDPGHWIGQSPGHPSSAGAAPQLPPHLPDMAHGEAP